MAYTKYSLTPANNTAAPPDGAPEGMLPSAVNDTMRDMMAQIRDCGDGIRDGTYTMTAPKITGGTITGSTINNSAIGGTTAAASKFTTLEATGVATFSAGTVSAPAITTTGDTNTGIFFPAADTIAFTEGGAESMRIDSNGQVGIGTTSPGYKLQVNGGSSNNNNDANTIVATGTNHVRLKVHTPTSGGFRASLVLASDEAITATGNEVSIQTTGSDEMQFATGGSERMRIDSSGNVGIGTSSPNNRLHVLGGTDTRSRVEESGGTFFDAVITNAGHFFDSTGTGDWTFNKIGSANMVFKTNNTERMRIDSNGDLLLGTTTNGYSAKQLNAFNGTSRNGIVLNETANSSNTVYAAFLNALSEIGSIRRVGATAAVVYNTTSDQRLKSNIADANPVLDKLMTVKVRQFDWTEGDLHQDAGFIAQELAPVLSGIVTQGKKEEDMWQMDYSRLTPYLVKAIQEQQALIESLTIRLTALENK